MSILAKNHRYYSANEQGATLIVVLMIVLLLSLVAAIAVRSGQVSLDMTTSAQANELLKQSSDVALVQVETASTKPAATPGLTQLELMAENDGPIGMLQIDGRKLAEYVMCYEPTVRDSLYQDKVNRVILERNGTNLTTELNRDGFCRLDNTHPNGTEYGYYTSARGTVATQVSMTRPTLDGTGALSKPLVYMPEGEDGESVNKEEAAYFRTYSTSVLPVLSISSTTENIEKCLNLPIGGLAGDAINQSQIRCLGNEDVPINIQVQDYSYIPELK